MSLTEQKMTDKNKESNNENIKDESMGFMDHLDELRKRILYALFSVIAACGLVAFKIDFIINEILLKPAVNVKLELQNLTVFGKPVLYFKVAIVCGIILAFPFILYQIWKFIEPALYNSEKNWAKKITFFTTICFLMGCAFAYYVMVPSMLQFSAGFGQDAIKNTIDINEYWSFITMMILTAGIVFEMPMISFVLSRFGLITPRFLKKYRRHSIIIILIAAAIITPSPDPVNQMIVAVPIYLLYEISILVSQMSLKKYYNS